MKELTDKEWIIFERGFEEGYQTAKRIYKPKGISITNEAGQPLMTPLIVRPYKKNLTNSK